MSTEQNNKAFAEADEVEAALRGLNRVEAPADFEMRLKARIADRRSSSRGTSFGFLKLAAPAALTVAAVVAGYVLMQQPSEDALLTNDQVAEVTTPFAAPVAETPLAVSTEIPQTASGGQPLNTTVANRQPERPQANQASLPVTRRPDVGGSVDRAVGEPEETIYPRGIEPNRPVEAIPVVPNGTAEIAVEEVLSLLGIRAAFEGGEWRVISTEANSAAARSGVRAGDVVLAMGTSELNGRRTLRADASIPSIRVRRSGSVLELRIGR